MPKTPGINNSVVVGEISLRRIRTMPLGPYHLQTQGKHERFHRTLQFELLRPTA
jgi:hypothetical protein